MGWSTAFLGATVISLAGVLMSIKSSITYSLGIVCMIIAIFWHRKVLSAAEAAGKLLREATQRDNVA